MWGRFAVVVGTLCVVAPVWAHSQRANVFAFPSRLASPAPAASLAAGDTPDVSAACVAGLQHLATSARYNTSLEHYKAQNPGCFTYLRVGYTDCTAGLDELAQACEQTLESRLCNETMVLELHGRRAEIDFGECYPQSCDSDDVVAMLELFDTNFCHKAADFDDCRVDACGFSSGPFVKHPGGGGLSGGAKAGIAIAVVVVVAGLAAGGFVWYKRRRATVPSLYTATSTQDGDAVADAEAYTTL